MKKNDKQYFDLIVRYVVIIFSLILFNSKIFYEFIKEITMYFSFAILKLLNWIIFGNKDVYISGDSIIALSNLSIIDACISPISYYLLFALVMSIKMDLGKRAKFIFYSLFFLTLVNIIRIVSMDFLLYYNTDLFLNLHMLIWHFFSIVIVILIFFIAKRLLKIDRKPLIDDIKFVWKDIRKK